MILPLLLASFAVSTQQAPTDRWMLFYAGYPKGGRATYTVQDCVRLIAVMDTTDKPAAWLSTGGIFLQIFATSGRGFFPQAGLVPATGADWVQYLDSLFAPSGALLRLDSAVAMVGAQVEALSGRFQVTPMIPYPNPVADSLRFLGTRYDLRVPERRTALVSAYVNEVRRRFAASHFPHLALSAFYWFREDIPAGDSAVVVAAAAGIHAGGQRFLWIPFFHAASREKWKELGFDAAWLQPNFFFHRDVPDVRLDSAVAEASAHGLGMEIEFDKRLLTDPTYQDRLGPYLAAFRANPTLSARGMAIYEGAGALIELSQGKSLWQRALYSRLVAIITGRPE